MNSAIAVSGLGKAYKHYPTRWARLIEWLDPRGKLRHSLHWVLKDINFSIEPGEAMGIVGVNGAGKSTLLKIITGTTQSTAGSVHIAGRIAALLELGMGFHPDFTGRQNALMTGQLLGHSVEEMAALMPHIEAFAEIGDYIDQPVRIYSSGMQVRLAFSVATASRPDILVVDEALSVGDAAFQRKCFRRIEGFQDEGTTLLLVTHDVETVKKICNKALYLRAGGQAGFGAAKAVCDAYEKDLFGGSRKRLPGAGAAAPAAPHLDPALLTNCEVSYGDDRAAIGSVWLESRDGQKSNVFGCNDPLVIKYRVHFNAAASGVVFAFMIKTKEGVALCGSDTAHMPKILKHAFEAGDTAEIRFEVGNAFVPGTYYLNCGVRDDEGETSVFLHRRVDTALFRVRFDDAAFSKAGVVNVPIRFSMETE